MVSGDSGAADETDVNWASAPGDGAGGASVIPPCITDQATMAQAADCRRKAADILRRNRPSWLKATLNLAAIDYTCPHKKTQTVPER